MPLLVTAAELSKELSARRQSVLIDLRPAEAFAEGHLPGAVHLDLFGLSIVDTDSAPLKAFFWMIEHLFASRGVESKSRASRA